MRKKFERIVEEKRLWTREQKILVTVSTGIDSMVLLDLLEQCHPREKLGVIHINHQLREASIQEEAYIREYCANHELSLTVVRWEQPVRGAGMEVAARDFRYESFRETFVAGAYDLLVTAHHGDDQLETVLMKLLRDGQLFSTRGIQWQQPFSSGRLVRPLLSFSKEEIHAYQEQRGLVFFEDESNKSQEMQRNRLRQQVIPLLKKENNQALRHVEQFSEQVSFAKKIVEKQQRYWLQEGVLQTSQTLEVAVCWYQKLEEAERFFFIQGFAWLAQQTFQVVIQNRQQEKLRQLLEKGASQWTIDLEKGWQIVREYETFTLRPTKQPPQTTDVLLSTNASCFLTENQWIGIFESGKEKIPKKVTNWSEYRQEFYVELNNHWKIRRIQPGDRIQLNPNLTKKISRYFIDKKIPRASRLESWVVVDEKGKIITLLPYAFSYLSIGKETDKILYVLLFKYKK